MAKNMFFLDVPPKKVVCSFLSDASFQQIILLGYDFYFAAIVRCVAKVYI